MNTITCTFDHHDYVSAVEGFARGSHLRQHIWEMMVQHHIPQMDDDFMDFCWWILYRNLWDCYFHKSLTNPHLGESAEIKTEVRCGAEDYLHALAVLHRGNRYRVHFDYDGKKDTILCYKFLGRFHPLEGKGWNQFVAPEYITSVDKINLPENKMVESSRYNEWTDLTIYDIIPQNNAQRND